MTQENENMSIWSQLCVTPPEHARPSTITQNDGTRLTLVKSQYRLQKLTEIFGPVGYGWGWEIVERWIDTWGSVQCAYVAVKLWYHTSGHDSCKVETGVQVGGTIVGENVDNIWKSSITDGIAKCAASIGLCSDAYMGEFSDTIPGQAAQSYSPKMNPTPDFGPAPAKAAEQPSKEREPEEKTSTAQSPPKEQSTDKPVCSATPHAIGKLCPKCGSHTVAIGKGGNPNKCWDCHTKFDNNGNVVQ